MMPQWAAACHVITWLYVICHQFSCGFDTKTLFCNTLPPTIVKPIWSGVGTWFMQDASDFHSGGAWNESQPEHRSWSRISTGFSSPSRHVPKQNLETKNDRFLPHGFQFTDHLLLDVMCELTKTSLKTTNHQMNLSSFLYTQVTIPLLRRIFLLGTLFSEALSLWLFPWLTDEFHHIH
jgi:hypothetical protein